MLLWNEPPQVFWFLLTSLATWRTALFLVREGGPFDLGTRLRGGIVRLGGARLVACHHCMSVWLAMLWVLLVYRPQVAYVVLVPAVAGASSIVELFLSTRPEELETDDA